MAERNQHHARCCLAQEDPDQPLIHNTPRERQVQLAAAFSAPDLEVGTRMGNQLARTESNSLCLPQEYLLANYAQAVTLTFSERSYRPFRVKCCE